MLQSIRYAHLILRFTLAFVFVWFGIDAFIHPSYWINAWLPSWLTAVLNNTGVTQTTFLSALGTFELLTGISLASGIFVRIFCIMATLFLVVIALSFGTSEIVVRNVGIIGGLLALFFWPDKRGNSSWDQF